MIGEVNEMRAFRRGQAPNAEVRQEVNDQVQSLAQEALNVQERLQRGGEQEVRRVANLADQFAAIDPRAAPEPLQADLHRAQQSLQEQHAVLSDDLQKREAHRSSLQEMQAAAKAQIVALNDKLKKTPSVHPATPIVAGVGDRMCTHMLNPNIGIITNAPRSRIPTGKI